MLLFGAELHEAFLSDVCAAIADGAFEAAVAWALEPSEPVPAGVGSWELPGLRQQGADLGERIFRVLDHGARDGAHVAAVGSDHPEIRPSTLDRAFELLDGDADVVLGPTSDGGYYLIAVTASALHRRLFEEIDWSTEAVCRQTLERCAELSLVAELLPEGHDVDVPTDLEALAERLIREPDGCPATRAALGRLGLLESDPKQEQSS